MATIAADFQVSVAGGRRAILAMILSVGLHSVVLIGFSPSVQVTLQPAASRLDVFLMAAEQSNGSLALSKADDLATPRTEVNELAETSLHQIPATTSAQPVPEPLLSALAAPASPVLQIPESEFGASKPAREPVESSERLANKAPSKPLDGPSIRPVRPSTRPAIMARPQPNNRQLRLASKRLETSPPAPRRTARLVEPKPSTQVRKPVPDRQTTGPKQSSEEVARARPASSAASTKGLSDDKPSGPPSRTNARPARGGADNPRPRYPYTARRKGLEGSVLLTVDVSSGGGAEQVVVARSSGVRSLDQAAMRAVQRWRFEPATQGGVAVPGQVQVPVKFELKNR